MARAAAKEQFYGTGRRKSATARVFIRPGKGAIVINHQEMEKYFNRETSYVIVREPFVATGLSGRFDVFATVRGGGNTGQAGAVRHGLARALLQYDPELRKALRAEDLLTRDSRIKERKKVGLKAARRAPQFSKR